jgi:threonine dehydratase
MEAPVKKTGVMTGPTAYDNAIMPWIPELPDVLRARRVISGVLPRTPLVPVPALSEKLGFNLWLKLESVLPTGAFKVRGGVNLVSMLPDALKQRGVVTASTGNHGQSIAFAAQAAGVTATIFVPVGANEVKVASMQRLGATVEFAGADFFETTRAAAAFASDRGAYYVHPANEPALVAGVATYSLEILEELPEIDALFVPIGGGSGLSGASIAAKTVKPSLHLVGVQAIGAPTSVEAWKARSLLKGERADTFAEGIATREAFDLPSKLFWDRVDDMTLVSDTDLKRSMLTIMSYARVVAEGAGAAALAAAYQQRDALRGKNVVGVVSGGNVTFDALKQIVDEERPW